MQDKDDVIEIDLQELFALLLRWIWLIAICGVAAALVGLMVCVFFVTPKYQSTTRIFILNRNNEATISYTDLQMSTTLTKNYGPLIKSRDVLEKVIEICELDEKYEDLLNRVTVETVGDTSLIAITVTDPDPTMAQLIAKEVRIAASEHIKEVMEIQAANLETEANLPEKPSSPSKMKWTLIGGLLGVFVCSAILIVQFLLDDTIKSAEEVEKYLGLSTLAMIPVVDETEKERKKKAHGAHYDAGVTRIAEDETTDMDIVVQDLKVQRKGGE